ncbi:MAG: radical SAM family heme chaperone HemW [Xanthomonadaceae bacterium]|nr:radical SAM family heme chaperone HemW [Xanthomonadaceae bacterium]
MSKYPSLYFHFPFCETKCHYCDFYSLARDRVTDDEVSRFERAMLREVELTRDQYSPEIKTIFCGGGTPSMTEPSSMERIFKEVFKYSRLATNYEWTMEANPSSVDRERMKAYRAIGINRVSMGVQSLRNDHLDQLGRVHDRANALKALEDLFAAGFTNVSCDLLCGVPGQTTEDLVAAIDTLTQFPITHLSCYILTLGEKHRMFPDLPKEDTQLEHYLCLSETMEKRGFKHYEISNFSKPGLPARHNLAYWTGTSYLGLGPSAHSFDAVKVERFKNYSSLHQYAEKLESSVLPIEWKETLTPDQRELEKWMLAVRLSDGFPKDWLVSEAARTKAENLMKAGLIQERQDLPSHYQLTPRGFAVSEQVIKELS